MIRSTLLLWALMPSWLCAAELKNWFNDPFLQPRDAIAGCAVPLGPLLTEAEMKSESHHRAERGTSCWLAGTCKEPNAYRYDAAIGQEIGRRFEQTRDFSDSSLWVTVKGRLVTVEGCVADTRQTALLEAWLRTVPDVDQVIVNVSVGKTDRPPYAVAK